MSHQSDPALVTQFRRRWGAGATTTIKFIGELSAEELDRLTVERGEAVVRGLSPGITDPLTVAERRDLARAFGRPIIRRLREKTGPAQFDAPRRTS